MKRSLVFIPLIAMMTSLASMTANGNELYGKPTVTVVQPRTVIQKGPVLARRIQKPKLFTGNPHKLVADDWDDDFTEIDDIITSYRRRDLNKLEHDEDELPQRIIDRLASAREKALEVYKKKWG